MLAADAVVLWPEVRPWASRAMGAASKRHDGLIPRHDALGGSAKPWAIGFTNTVVIEDEMTIERKAGRTRRCTRSSPWSSSGTRSSAFAHLADPDYEKVLLGVECCAVRRCASGAGRRPGDTRLLAAIRGTEVTSGPAAVHNVRSAWELEWMSQTCVRRWEGHDASVDDPRGRGRRGPRGRVH